MIKRTRYLQQISQELSDTDKILFLIWARQVGKSTLLKSLFEFDYIPLETSYQILWDELSFQNIATVQDLLEHIQLTKNLDTLKYLIIDEAQYITNIGTILKVLIDKVRNKEYHFKIIVSGSGSLNTFKGMTDSLIGRKHILHIYPFDFQEFLQIKWINHFETKSKTTIKTYLQYFHEYILRWWYPQVVLTKDPEKKSTIFKDLINDYIFKDVLLLLEQKDLIKFKTFLKLIASKVWSVFHISQLVEELWVSRYIMEKYLFVVENTFLLHKLTPRYKWWFQNEYKKKQKIYFTDIGILRYLLGVTEWIGDQKGKIIENFVCNELFVHKKHYEEILFRGTSDGGEVDFILEDQAHFTILPIEVKSWNKTHIPKSLSHFLDTYKQHITKSIITTEHTHQQREWKIFFIPYTQIFSAL